MQDSLEVRLAREIYAIEREADLLGVKIDALKLRHTNKLAELQNYLVNEGKTSTGHIDGVGEFQLKRVNHVGVTQAKMPDFVKWLRLNGLGGIVVETVHSSTLKKTIKDKLDEYTELFVEDVDAAAEHQKTLCPELLSSELVPPAELAKKVMEMAGASVFQEIKISHTKKGK